MFEYSLLKIRVCVCVGGLTRILCGMRILFRNEEFLLTFIMSKGED